jgi:hypothetical protein
MFSLLQNIHTLHITSVRHCFILLGIKTVGINSFKLNGNGMILTMDMQSRLTREGETKDNGKSLITVEEVLIKNLAIFFLFHSKLFYAYNMP